MSKNMRILRQKKLFYAIEGNLNHLYSLLSVDHWPADMMDVHYQPEMIANLKCPITMTSLDGQDCIAYQTKGANPQVRFISSWAALAKGHWKCPITRKPVFCVMPYREVYASNAAAIDQMMFEEKQYIHASHLDLSNVEKFPPEEEVCAEQVSISSMEPFIGLSPLYVLVLRAFSKDDTTKQFWRLFCKTSSYLRSLPVEAWARPILIGGHRAPSALHIMAVNNSEFMYQWQKAFPDHFNMIPPQAWSQSPVTGRFQGRTMLHALMLSPYSIIIHGYKTRYGIVVLSNLIKQRPDLFSKIEMSAWLTSDKAGLYALYTLSRCQPGINLIRSWQAIKNSSFYALPDAVWKNIPHGHDAFQCQTPMFCLSSFSEGISLLTKWLRNNPKTFIKIPISAWGLYLKPMNRGGFMALYNLTTSVQGRLFLLSWYQAQPNHFLQIPPESWSDTFTGSDSTWGSSLSNMVGCQNGIALLSQLLQKNGNYLSRIPIESWVEPFRSTLMSGITPLCALAEKQDGRRFLCGLQKLQPVYFYRIPISAWAQPSHESSGKPPAFWWLTADKNTTAMLYDWQRMNPDYFYRISALMWSKAPVSGKYQGVTALYNLVANGGIKILSRMLALNRHIFSCLTTNAWSKSSDIFKASAFSACSGNEYGRRLLYHWQKSDPASFYALPPSVWRAVINPDFADYSPIFCFTTCPRYGIKILISLIEQQPELFNEIPLHVWYKTVSVRCDNFGNSAFF